MGSKRSHRKSGIGTSRFRRPKTRKDLLPPPSFPSFSEAEVTPKKKRSKKKKSPLSEKVVFYAGAVVKWFVKFTTPIKNPFERETIRSQIKQVIIEPPSFGSTSTVFL